MLTITEQERKVLSPEWLERYDALIEKVDVPDELFKFTPRAYFLLKASRIPQKAFIKVLKRAGLNNGRWFKSAKEDFIMTIETNKDKAENTNAKGSDKYARCSQEDLTRLLNSEVEMNNATADQAKAEAEKARAIAEQARSRKAGWLDHTLTATSIVAVGAMAYFFIDSAIRINKAAKAAAGSTTTTTAE